MKKKLFIAFEGIDGSGKSTQVNLLKERLEAAGLKVYTTFEPTDNPIGKMIREVFSGKMEADHKVIAGLFVADRLHHLLNKENGILKKLEEGYTVITDRFYFSSYAYHAVHMPMDWVIQANSMSASLLRPDVNIYIDITPDESMARIQKSREVIELYETLDNLKQVKLKYEEAFEHQKNIENIITVLSEKNAEDTSQEIWEKLKGQNLV